MNCFWVEKMMVDLLILKKHKRVIKKFNTPRPAKIPKVMLLERAEYWKKDFKEILENYTSEFDPIEEKALNHLRHAFFTRNMLSHCNVKMGQKYFLYRPANKNKLKNFFTILKRKKLNQSKPLFLKIDLSEEYKYLEQFKIFEYLDRIYFKKEAETLGIKYSHLR